MDDGELVQRLRGGGYIFAFRHAATIADQKDTQPLNLRDCSAQRNLSDQGRADARAIGLAMTSASIRVGAVLASPFCRTRETAVIAFGRVELSPALFGETEERLSALRQLFSTVPEPGLNTVLVTHAASLAAIFGGVPTDVAEGDALIILPSDNGSFELLGRLTLGDWPRLLAVSQ
jgi:phosphohistidine phosphatase SixA